MPSLAQDGPCCTFTASRAVSLAGLLIAGVISAAFIDIPLAHWLNKKPLPKLLNEILSAAEHFGTAYGEILILFTLFIALPDGRRRLWRLVAGAWGAGLVADVVKLAAARTRPKHYDFGSADGWAGFHGLFSFGAGGSRQQSFPSAHTATAFGFAVVLSHFFPRGRIAFFTLAALVGLQRLEHESHFLSDVLAGAAIGLVVGLIVTGHRRVGRFFDKLEAPTR
jgi:membrane-associated phospholipid phosphatase